MSEAVATPAPAATPEPGLEPRTVALRTPIQWGAATIVELRFRPPKAKDLRRLPMIEGFELDTILILAGRLSGSVEQVIDKLEGDDLKEVIDVVGGFLRRFQPAGSDY
jgi:hypothetical protein